jgi:hypothetical protein
LTWDWFVVPQAQIATVEGFVQGQEDRLELQGGEVIPPFLLEVAVVGDAIKDVREGKARRVAAAARGELVKARAMQASVARPKRKRQEDDEGEEDKASDAEDDEGEEQDKGKGKDEGADASEGEDKVGDEGEDEKDDEEDDEGMEGAMPVKRRRKAAEVSGPPSAREKLTKPTGGDEGRGAAGVAGGAVRAVRRRRGWLWARDDAGDV